MLMQRKRREKTNLVKKVLFSAVEKKNKWSKMEL